MQPTAELILLFSHQIIFEIFAYICHIVVYTDIRKHAYKYCDDDFYYVAEILSCCSYTPFGREIYTLCVFVCLLTKMLDWTHQLGTGQRAKITAPLNRKNMTTQTSKSLRGKGRQSAEVKESENRLMRQKSISVNFGRSEMRVCRSAGKGRRTTLVSEYVSSSRSSHFSGSHRPPTLRHWRGGRRRGGGEGQGRGGGREEGGTAHKTLSTQ